MNQPGNFPKPCLSYVCSEDWNNMKPCEQGRFCGSCQKTVVDFTEKSDAEIQEMFAPAFHKATTEEQRENLKRLAWFSTEFGLIRENGELRIFGTGLISSSGEMEHVLAGNTPIEPFKVETIANFDKAIWSFNKTLFEFDSLSALKAELARYFDTF